MTCTVGALPSWAWLPAWGAIMLYLSAPIWRKPR